MLTIITLACLHLCPQVDSYVQDGYNPPPPPPEALHVLSASPPEPPPPVETAAAVDRGMGNGASDVEQWRPLVAGQFPPPQVDNALCVIRSESGGNPSAKNPSSNARGLFQVMSSVWGPHFGFTHSDFYIPERNVYAAARIWEMDGWSPWSPRTRRNCGL
jgi:hypothetical protein